jgi:linoleate 10R-lipoxygenase
VPKVDGVGLAPGYTIITAILSDAIALVRGTSFVLFLFPSSLFRIFLSLFVPSFTKCLIGDRFLTTEDTPRVLTQWGYDEARSHDQSHYGTIIGEKLIHHHLGPLFPPNYVGTVFPFNTPAENQVSPHSYYYYLLLMLSFSFLQASLPNHADYTYEDPPEINHGGQVKHLG